MGKGIAGILTDKIFPATTPGEQIENGNLKALLFSPPITKGDADTALNHITERFVARQTLTSQTALLNTRIGALLGVQVGTYNVGVGATDTDPLNPNRKLSSLDRGARIVGGTIGIVSAPFSKGGQSLTTATL